METMVEITARGRELLERYLAEVRLGVRGDDVEVEEVVSDVRDHVHAALDRGPSPAGEEAVAEVLRRLGDPADWGDPAGSDRPSRGASADLRRWAWGVFALTGIGVALFPWVGPLLLLVAWVAARAVLARIPSGGRIPGDLRWLLLPPVVLGVVAVVAVVALGPLMPWVEWAARFGDAAPLVTAVGALLWWLVLALVVRMVPGLVKRVVHPFWR